jgi:hypothetical protein
LSAQRLASGVALLAAAALAGCYGSTEPATDVGPDRATLNAKGTANDGPARSYFEYWHTGSTGRVRTTGDRRWPAGASGPFSEKLTSLAAEAPYSFRVCGADDDGDEPICAQTRTFTTTAAVKDAVHGGEWGGCCYSFSVDATSGPSGGNPQGSMHLRTGNSFDPVSTHFSGFVTCLSVDGTQAAVGAVGQRTQTPGETTPATLLATIEDGRVGADTLHVGSLVSGSTPPDCSTASFDSQGTVGNQFEFVVNDAAP